MNNAEIYALLSERHFDNMASQSGYTRKTHIFRDLSMAEYEGEDKLLAKYQHICDESLSDYVIFTEFVLCLNWKIWDLYEKNEPMAEVYNYLWEKAQELFYEHYEGNEEANEYFFRVTD